ncbi:MAG TPA: hypothetical protein VNJ29_01170, partial [Candidatus Nitrosotenuis sp.]|nr:hypothetical protein [Candidatus Nitrosotenuis sp.]
MRIKKVLPFFLLSFTLSQFSVQALEDNLTETINTYLQAKKNKPSEVVEYGYGSYITYPLGYGLRYAGDWLRSPSDTSTIIKGETSKHVASYVGSDNFQGKVVTQLTNNESIMESFWRGSGNGL